MCFKINAILLSTDYLQLEDIKLCLQRRLFASTACQLFCTAARGSALPGTLLQMGRRGGGVRERRHLCGTTGQRRAGVGVGGFIIPKIATTCT